MMLNKIYMAERFNRKKSFLINSIGDLPQKCGSEIFFIHYKNIISLEVVLKI